MKTIKVFITGLLVLMGSCGDDKEERFSRSFVRNYFSVEEIKLDYVTTIRGDKVIYIFSSSASSDRVHRPFLCGYESRGSEKALYDALCLKHNDMSYNRTIVVDFLDGREMSRYDYIAFDFVSLRIVSDADFDGEHPAGTDLGDVVRYAYFSPKKYIDSGYVDEFDWTTAGGLAGSLFANAATKFEHPIDKLVSELTPDDMILFRAGYLGVLRFERPPSLSQAHRLTVTMTTDEGVELSASIDMDF